MFGEQALLDRLWLPFACTSAVDALGVMVANGSTTVNGQLILQTAQPTSSTNFQKVLYINGPTNVPANGVGRCTMAQAPIFALYSGDTPSAGDKLGPQASSWSLLKDNSGYLAVGDGDGTKVLVVRNPLNDYAPPILYAAAKMRRQSDDSLLWTITSTDPGTWQLSASVEGNDSDSHVTRLTASVWNDPCLQIDRTGMWLITFQHKLWVDNQSPHADEYTSTLTGESDAHTHSYDKFDTPLAWEITTTLETQIDETYYDAMYNRSFITRWNEADFVIQNLEQVIVNINAGANLRITTEISKYNHAQIGTFTCNGYLICRWLGPRSE